MRVLVTVIAVKTHLYNVVPMAWALQAAGHEVRVASQPDLVEAITNAGLTAVAVGDPLGMGRSEHGPRGQTFRAHGGGMLVAAGEEPTWEHALGALTVACAVEYEFFAGQTVLDDLVEFARGWQPDLVVWDALTFSGAVAARACGAAHARMLFGIDYITQMYGHFVALRDEQPADRRDDPVADWLTGRLGRYGCEFDPSDALELMTGQVTIDPTPAWMQLPLGLPVLPVRFVPFNGAASVPQWIYDPPRRPRVCLSLGMSGRDLFGGDLVSVADLLTALAELDIELVATLNADQLAAVTTLPDNVRAVDFVPLNELAPTCTAIIHHGGFGTLGNVLVHGIPSLTVPAPWWDEKDLGTHLHNRHAGIHLDPHTLTPDTVKTALHQLLTDPTYQHHATNVQHDVLTTPTPNDVTTQLEQLAAGPRA
ncbi:activator-dependent family glycosyltransferase [Solwaraspora sp. WMMA2080]|uniref:activator-dependent family glycosyltransferase n=1 Tax=unclassified Solwaraspora TaxID=2627926 RepID=UPI00248CFBA3|nr:MULTISPECIES: activator-dependent family glycosyltransferase [unclassified Solwaraspora]WBB98273.1 activator-dependent family glycosyltransferase [Solwaraspora sp. WMMA2059]WBC23172.1 activator-dependent family glycosyltransferase [Solwaraspora sp. WMMA2080]